jgi:hypothetical protein
MTNEIKKWRPEGWETLKAKNHPLHCLLPDDCVGSSYEAGADAMLESLRSSPDSLTVPGDRKVHVKEEDGCSFAFIIKRKGTLVFIPDDDDIIVTYPPPNKAQIKLDKEIMDIKE